MFEDEKQVIECARRWYAAVKYDQNRGLTIDLEHQLAAAVVIFERERKLMPLKPKPIRRFVSGR